MAHLDLTPAEAAQILSPVLPFVDTKAVDVEVDADANADANSDKVTSDDSASAAASTPFLLMGQPPRQRNPDAEEAQRREETLTRMRGLAYGSKLLSTEKVREFPCFSVGDHQLMVQLCVLMVHLRVWVYGAWRHLGFLRPLWR